MAAPDHGGGPGDSTSPGPPPSPEVPDPADLAEAAGGGTPGRREGFVVLAAGGVALGMHLAVGAAYALTLALAPLWVSGVVALWWVFLLAGGLIMLARRSPFVLAVPLLAIASWAALITAGRAWFGWR